MVVIEYLESFNRKERFHLVGQLLGNTEFKLDPIVFMKILSILGLEPPLRYFSAMDYHLDWIHASLTLAYGEKSPVFFNDNACITATNEDVDFLIAFIDDIGITHIIMIEAKGDTSFTNAQLKSKADRLSKIFGEDGANWKTVRPHFLVCSPKQSMRIDYSELCPFMINQETKSLNWFRLYMPVNQRKVTRCNEDGGVSQGGQYWKIEEIRQLQS